jgi:uncharacterized protein (DUF58 family)
MPTRRGWAAFAAGLSLWVAARLVGSPDLHILAVGTLTLPLLALLFVRWTNVRLSIRRHLSSTRVFAGTRVDVDLVVENLGRGTTSFLLLEDARPAALGRPARLVVSGIPPRNSQTVHYSIPCRQRGRYRIGPLSIFVTDPFGLARSALESTAAGELIVYPQVEDIGAGHLVSQGAGAGESAVRHLHRSAAEFYTMREYVTGDDLRRIHWPSVAKTGSLMIRQDEATRRSSATVFLDNRQEVLGGRGLPGFERAVSVAASVGRALTRTGFAVRLATADSPATVVTEELLLETLANIGPSRAHGTADVLKGLRAGSLGDATLVYVSAPPSGADLPVITRVGSAFGRKVAVFVYPAPPQSLAEDAASEIRSRAGAARASLLRSGWDVYTIAPDGRLADTWQNHETKRLRAVASSS